MIRLAGRYQLTLLPTATITRWLAEMLRKRPDSTAINVDGAIPFPLRHLDAEDT